MRQIPVEADGAGQRLDQFLADRFPRYSRTHLQRAIDKGHVVLNGLPVKKNCRLERGAIVGVEEDELEKSAASPLAAEDIAIDILYEDDALVAVNKPPGLVVHPGSGNRAGTLVNALLFHVPNLSTGSAADRPGIVHRLDKDTSGVILVARTDAVHEALGAMFARREMEKHYVGFCIGRRPQERETIDAPVGRRSRDRLRFCVRGDGKAAVTECALIDHKSGISLMHFRPRTGRTHQIRVHCSARGFPVVGDTLYGGGASYLSRLAPMDKAFAGKVLGCFGRHALHARSLRFAHPVTGKEVSLVAPFPEDFRKAFLVWGGGIDRRIESLLEERGVL